MTLPGDIFKTYDIRGQNLTGDMALIIGRALGTYFQQAYAMPLVVVGHDFRPNADDLRAGLIAGLTQTGCDVLNLGPTATPVVYFNAIRRGCAGVMITASHLTYEHNGFKCVIGGKVIFGDELQSVYALTQSGECLTGSGTIQALERANAQYADWLVAGVRPACPLRIVVDARRSMADLTIWTILERLGHDAIPLDQEPGPDHTADPSIHANLASLAAATRAHGADLGLAFDGDADRVGVVDDSGAIISADRALAWLAEDTLRRNPGAAVVADVMASQSVFDHIAARGGKPVMARTGHAYVRAQVQSSCAIMGGEVSGHMFFPDRGFAYDDGLGAACRIAERLASSDQPLSAQMRAFPQVYSTPVYRPTCPAEARESIIPAVKARLDSAYPVGEIDGLRITFPDGWGILRLSNTEPRLTLRFEADSEARALDYKAALQDILTDINPAIEDF